MAAGCGHIETITLKMGIAKWVYNGHEQPKTPFFMTILMLACAGSVMKSRFAPAMTFCVVFSPYTHGRHEADWRISNDVANAINLFGRKTLHKVGTAYQSG